MRLFPMRFANLAPPGPVAQRIQGIVQECPGIHFRALGRAADLTSTGQLRHHVDRLVRRGLLSEVGDGRYRRYFPANHCPDLQPQLARMSRPLPRRIVRLLLSGPMSRTAMRRSLGCADSTLGYHLARMLREGDLQQQRERRGSSYLLADPARVRRILLAQEARPQLQVAEPYVVPAIQAPAIQGLGLAPAAPQSGLSTNAATPVLELEPEIPTGT